MYGKVAVIGAGLIGGSVGLDLKERKLAQNVCAWGRNPQRLRDALDRNACDEVTQDLRGAVEGAQVIILATPPDIIRMQMKEMKGYLKEGMLVMDVGSVKNPIIEAASRERLCETGAEFVGCHPMAGSEKSGVANARMSLFKDAPCILTPAAFNTDAGIKRAADFWETLGARVIRMDPVKHDLTAGFLSHLPHVLAFVILRSIEKIKADLDSVNDIAGPSFRHLNRLAGSSPDLWAKIFEENRDQVIISIDTFAGELARFRKLLKKKDYGEIKLMMESVAAFRKNTWKE